MGANYAAENDFMFIETSCLKNENVAGGFETLIELTYRDVVQKEKEEMIILNGNHHQKQKTKWSCC